MYQARICCSSDEWIEFEFKTLQELSSFVTICIDNDHEVWIRKKE